MTGTRAVAAIEPELTWTGERFERGVRVEVDDAGRIAAVTRADERDGAAGGVGDPAAGHPATADAAADPATGEPLRPDRLPRRALLPGFVNAHSHAFQRGLRGRGERFPVGAGSFWTWRQAMYELVEGLGPKAVERLSLQAFLEMRAAGITTVGEFHYLHHADGAAADWALDEAVLAAAREAGIRIVLLQVFYRWGGPGKELEGAQRRFRSPSVEAYLRQLDRLAAALDPARESLGIVAHSLRAATPDEVAELWAEAEQRDLPFHMHLEEQRQEIAEIASAYDRRPMELLLERLDLSERFTGVHCTHTAPEDMAAFGAAGGSVCICPTTEANLGDGTPDLPGILASGAGLCLGTDSNARISMLEEARWLELAQRLAREQRGIALDGFGRVAPTLLQAATTGGAKALALDTGTIRPGAHADFCLIDLAHPELEGCQEDTLLESIFLGASDRIITGTAVAGRWQMNE